MPSCYENAMLNCLMDKYKLPPHSSRGKKVAIIGERVNAVTGNVLKKALNQKHHILMRDIKIFTSKNKFKGDMAKNYDFLLAIRPCEGEIEVLEGATKHGTKFMLMPCNCDRVVNKVPKLIRDYPVIKYIDSYVPAYDDGSIEGRLGWMILYN